MNLNKLFIPLAKDTPDVKYNKRAKVDTGTTCNYKCDFCYYYNSLNAKFKDIAIIKKEILLLYKIGIKEFDLSGGESSIHPYFIEIITHAKQYGKVSTLSNGSMFHDIKFLEKCKQAGLQEVLFSLHGYDNISHDKIVHHKTAFDKIIKSIINCNELGIEVRLNCTIDNTFNEKKYLELLNKLRFTQLNLLPLNYWDDASSKKSIDYKLIGNKAKYIIDNLLNIECNVRYIPFCFMKEYEKNVVGVFQHIYDLKDWNLHAYDLPDTKLTKNKMFEAATKNRIASFTKPLSCKDCSMAYICDGIEPQNLDDNKLEPYKGNKQPNVLYWRQHDKNS